jgi:cytochrome c-type biogenesis protein CcmE
MAYGRRRVIRLTTALTAAVLLAGALIYTSFSSAAQVRSPSQLAGAVAGRTYEVSGIVLPGYTRSGTRLDFRMADRAGGQATAVLVRYTGEVPDPFKAGREVIVTVTKSGSSFVGEKDTLVTKCPSKFAAAPPTSARPAPGN